MGPSQVILLKGSVFAIPGWSRQTPILQILPGGILDTPTHLEAKILTSLPGTLISRKFRAQNFSDLLSTTGGNIKFANSLEGIGLDHYI